MRIIRNIALTELQTLFFSPVAWFILIIFTFQSGMYYTSSLFEGWVRAQDMNYSMNNLTLQMFGGNNGLFTTVQGYLYLYIPLLTMGLMSRELGSGSIKLLYSSPVKNSQIILGKFLSMCIYGLILIAILFLFVIWGQCTIINFDLPIALSGLLGLYLLILAYAAIGLFMSSLTSYQVVAAVGTLAVLAALNFVSRIGQGVEFIRELTWWLSISGRANESVNGLICSEDVIYFLVIIGMFLALSILRLKAIRQKAGWKVSFGKYALVVVIAFAVGYLSSRPSLMTFYDATRTQQRTLTENSQNIVKEVKGGLTITTYVNLLDANFSSGLPRYQKWDVRPFEQYIRFKPEIKLKYVYYYARPAGDAIEKRYPGLSDKEVVAKIASAYSVDSNLFKPLNELKNVPDLQSEGYRYVRLVERENGNKTFLRMFDDMQRSPSEQEISAALKRLAMDLPVIGFLNGQGERAIDMEGDRGYFRFSKERPFRYSLINQGFDLREVALNQFIPDDITILVIADMRRTFTEEEQSRLDAYIARGGNLLIAGEPNRQEIMNPFLERLGVQLLPGQLVKRMGANKENERSSARREPGAITFQENENAQNDHFQADFIIATPSPESRTLSYRFDRMAAINLGVTMPGCVGISYVEDKGFKVIPLFQSDTLDSWNELQTTNFIDDTVRIDSHLGEVMQSHPTAVALSRDINGREQKIVILGDADCISNGEISIQRSKVRAANYEMIMGTFFWLSDNEVPIDIRRETPPDTGFNCTKQSVKASKWLMMGILPFLLLLSCILILIRRKGQ